MRFYLYVQHSEARATFNSYRLYSPEKSSTFNWWEI